MKTAHPGRLILDEAGTNGEELVSRPYHSLRDQIGKLLKGVLRGRVGLVGHNVLTGRCTRASGGVRAEYQNRVAHER